MFRNVYYKKQKYYLKITLEGGFYPQAVMFWRYIHKTKVTKEPLVEDKDYNNENEMNTQMNIKMTQIVFGQRKIQDTSK